MFYRVSVSLVVAVSLSFGTAYGGDLTVTVVPGPPTGPSILVAQPHADAAGNTSVRHFTTRDVQQLYPNPADPAHHLIYRRDRDLGQTFTVPGTTPYLLDAVTLRVGFDSLAVRPGAPGAAVSLQLFEVTGTPVLHDNGTTSQQVVSWTSDPRADDYITGLTFTSLAVARGGTLPQNLAPGSYMKWDLSNAARIPLLPGRRYAFLVMLDNPGDDSSFTLANQYWGTYPGGHGVRREGRVPEPWNNLDLVFNGNGGDPLLSALPSDFAERTALSPGTWGRPDVDTWRDLTFFIHTAHIPEPAYVGIMIPLTFYFLRRPSW